MSDDQLESAQEPAVGCPVQRRVRPFAWACVWPAEDGCGGGGFTTLDERTALNYMAGATERGSSCRPTLVPLYDAQAVDEILASERKRSATLRAMVTWLEANQPDVFKRGMWDAINAAAA